jgi:hypothetical protein
VSEAENMFPIKTGVEMDSEGIFKEDPKDRG